jgi:hypothetical protein
MKKPGKLKGRSLTRILRPKSKKRPRGKPFAKGNCIGKPTWFAPGNTVNPGGRPKAAEISRASRAWLAEETTVAELIANKLPVELAGCTHAEVITWVRGQQALEGNLPSAVELADRAEGKPRTSVGFELDGDPLSALLAEVQKMSAQIGPPEGAKQEESE